MGAVISRLLAVVLLASATLVGVLAGPAAAACPRTVTLEERAQAADDVFTGTVEKRAVSGSTVSYTVAVQQVYQGSVSTARVTVTTGTRPRACGLPDIANGERYVFFARERGGELTTGRRTGTARATAAYVARVEALLGTGRPAVAPPPPPAAEVTFTTVAGEPTELQRVAAPGVALVLVGLLGFALASWRGRRRS